MFKKVCCIISGLSLTQFEPEVMRRIFIVHILILCCVFVTQGQVAKFEPRVDTVDNQLASFLDTLRKSSVDRDIDLLCSLSCKNDVKIDFGQGINGTFGKQGFKVFVEKYGDYFWKKLEELVDVKGTYISEHTYAIPFTVTAFKHLTNKDKSLQGDFVPLLAVVEDSVELFQQPDSSSKVVYVSSYDVFEAVSDLNEKWDENINDYRWKAVIYEGETAYIRWEDVLPNTGFQIILTKKDNGWCFKSFIFYGS